MFSESEDTGHLMEVEEQFVCYSQIKAEFWPGEINELDLWLLTQDLLNSDRLFYCCCSTLPGQVYSLDAEIKFVPRDQVFNQCRCALS